MGPHSPNTSCACPVLTSLIMLLPEWNLFCHQRILPLKFLDPNDQGVFSYTFLFHVLRHTFAIGSCCITILGHTPPFCFRPSRIDQHSLIFPFQFLILMTVDSFQNLNGHSTSTSLPHWQVVIFLCNTPLHLCIQLSVHTWWCYPVSDHQSIKPCNHILSIRSGLSQGAGHFTWQASTSFHQCVHNMWVPSTPTQPLTINADNQRMLLLAPIFGAENQRTCPTHLRQNNGMLYNTAGTFTWDISFAYLMKVITTFFHYVGPHENCLCWLVDRGGVSPSIMQEQAGLLFPWSHVILIVITIGSIQQYAV